MNHLARTLPAVVHEWVEREPDRLLFTFRDLSGEQHRESHLTYGQLWQQATGMGNALGRLDRDDLVVLVLPLGTELVAAHLGVLLAGGVPVIFSHPSDKISQEAWLRKLEHVLNLVKPERLISDAEHGGAIASSGVFRAESMLQTGKVPDSSEAVDEWTKRSPQDLAVIQHSSGSTGAQKGVALTHEMVLKQCDAYAKTIQLNGDGDKIASWLPLYHDMGLFTSWLLPLIHGAQVLAIDPFQWVKNPASILQLIADHKATLCWQPNFAYSLIASRVKMGLHSSLDLSSMRGFVNCAEPVRARFMRSFEQALHPCGIDQTQMWVCYAMAENAFAVTSSGHDKRPVSVLQADSNRLAEGVFVPSEGGLELVSVGKPIDGCEIQVLDLQKQSVAEGVVGELAIRSPYMLREYYRNPEATNAAISPDGWFYTGDLGFCHDGEYYITGRSKDVLIVGGRNFYPQDLEHICEEEGEVIPGRSVAIGVDDERAGTQQIVMLAEINNLSQKNQAQLRQLELNIRNRIFEELDCSVSEVHLVHRGWLEKTTSGKIARQANLSRYRELERQKHAESRAAIPADWRYSIALGVMLGISIFAFLLFQGSLSWGVYAEF